MKYKRIFTIFLTCLLALCLVGCGDPNTESAVANNLEKDSIKLEKIVETLDDLNDEDIIIEDLSPLSEKTKASSVLQKSAVYTVGGQKANSSILTQSPKQNANNAKFVNADKINLTEQDSQRIRKNSYTPKYTSENTKRDNLDEYLQNIEDMFNCCSDCVNCNNECKTEMSVLEQNIRDCKVICSKLKDGTISLTQEEISECYNCMESLTNCMSRLELTKGNITSKCKEVERLKDNFGSNVGGLQNAYQKLLSALESRLDYVKECNENFSCIFNIINKANVDMTDAEKNKSDEKDIVEDWQQYEEAEEPYQTDNISKKNTNNIRKIKNVVQNSSTYPVENGMPYDNGYGYNYGYNGYGFPYQPYPPRNIDTYRYIQKNIDTYRPNYVPNQNNSQNNQQNVTRNENVKNNDLDNDTSTQDEVQNERNRHIQSKLHDKNYRQNNAVKIKPAKLLKNSEVEKLNRKANNAQSTKNINKKNNSIFKKNEQNNKLQNAENKAVEVKNDKINETNNNTITNKTAKNLEENEKKVIKNAKIMPKIEQIQEFNQKTEIKNNQDNNVIEANENRNVEENNQFDNVKTKNTDEKNINNDNSNGRKIDESQNLENIQSKSEEKTEIENRETDKSFDSNDELNHENNISKNQNIQQKNDKNGQSNINDKKIEIPENFENDSENLQKNENFDENLRKNEDLDIQYSPIDKVELS